MKILVYFIMLVLLTTAVIQQTYYLQHIDSSWCMDEVDILRQQTSDLWYHHDLDHDWTSDHVLRITAKEKLLSKGIFTRNI